MCVFKCYYLPTSIASVIFDKLFFTYQSFSTFYYSFLTYYYLFSTFYSSFDIFSLQDTYSFFDIELLSFRRLTFRCKSMVPKLLRADKKRRQKSAKIEFDEKMATKKMMKFFIFFVSKCKINRLIFIFHQRSYWLVIGSETLF